MKGGGRLGGMLDAMVNRKAAPDMKKTMAYFGLKIESEKPPKEGDVQPAWLGLNLSVKGGRIILGSHMSGSPVRDHLMPGDEIVAINGLRTSTTSGLETVLKGMTESEVAITYAHEGVLRACTIRLPGPPHHDVKLIGKGNNRWRSYIATRQND